MLAPRGNKLEELRRRLQAPSIKVDWLFRCDDSSQAAFTFLVPKDLDKLSIDELRERARRAGRLTHGSKERLIGRLETAYRVPVSCDVLKAASPVLEEACSSAVGHCLLPIDCDTPELHIIAQALEGDTQDVLACRARDGEKESVLRIITHATALGLHDMVLTAVTVCLAELGTEGCATGFGLRLLDVAAQAARASGSGPAVQKWVSALAELAQHASAAICIDGTREQFEQHAFGRYTGWDALSAPGLALIARALPADADEPHPHNAWDRTTLSIRDSRAAVKLALKVDDEQVPLILQAHCAFSEITAVTVAVTGAVPVCVDTYLILRCQQKAFCGRFVTTQACRLDLPFGCDDAIVWVRRSASNARINLLLDWLRKNTSPHASQPELPRRAPLPPAMWCTLIAYLEAAHGVESGRSEAVFDQIVLPHAARHFAEISSCAEFSNVPLRVAKLLIAQKLSGGSASDDDAISAAARWAAASAEHDRAQEGVELLNTLGLANRSLEELKALTTQAGALRDACVAHAPLRAAFKRELASAVTKQLPSYEPSHKLICPLTRQLMEEPTLLIEDGQTYSKAALELWLQEKDTSPTTLAVLRSKATVPNLLAGKMVEEAHERMPKRRRLLTRATGPTAEQGGLDTTELRRVDKSDDPHLEGLLSESTAKICEMVTEALLAKWLG